jgi:hypothetical protein
LARRAAPSGALGVRPYQTTRPCASTIRPPVKIERIERKCSGALAAPEGAKPIARTSSGKSPVAKLPSAVDSAAPGAVRARTRNV